MELTFVTDLGQSFVVEIDPNMELENVMALLEAEVSCSRVLYRRSHRLIHTLTVSAVRMDLFHPTLVSPISRYMNKVYPTKAAS